MVALLRQALVLWVVLVAGPVTPSLAQSLTVDTAGDAVKIRAVGFSALQGDPLARLKDGRTVRIEFTAMVLPAPGKSAVATVRRIFAVSYDLWEERFAVTTVEKASRSASHLALAAAEAWCIDQLAFPISALGTLGRDAPFWLRLEYRILEAESTSESSDAGYTLQGLIDALSRRRKTVTSSPAVESGPFRLKPQHPVRSEGLRARF